MYNLSYQILNIILPIITVPYVTRIFTSEELGNYGFYNSIVSYFALFAMLGISIYGTKQIAASRDVSSTLEYLHYSSYYEWYSNSNILLYNKINTWNVRYDTINISD